MKKLISFSFLSVVLFIMPAYAEYLGNGKINRKGGIVENYINFSPNDEIKLAPRESYEFIARLSNMVYRGYNSEYLKLKNEPNHHTWITIIPNNSSPKKILDSLSFQMNGREAMKFVVFSVAFKKEVKNQISIFFHIEQKDVDSQEYTITIKNTGKKAISFFIDDLETIYEFRTDWKEYYGNSITYFKEMKANTDSN